MTLQFVLFAIAAATAVGVVLVLDRRSRVEVVGAPNFPSSVDPRDLPSLEENPALVLFSHRACRACDAARTLLARQPVELVEVASETMGGLFERYGIEDVPTTLLCDRGGAVVAAWVGPLRSAEVSEAIARLDL